MLESSLIVASVDTSCSSNCSNSNNSSSSGGNGSITVSGRSFNASAPNADAPFNCTFWPSGLVSVGVRNSNGSIVCPLPAAVPEGPMTLEVAEDGGYPSQWLFTFYSTFLVFVVSSC